MSPPERPASLRYHPGSGSGAIVAFGPFRFDRTNRLLARGAEEIPLPPRVVGVLEYLIDRAGKVVPKEALIQEVWQGSHVTDTSPAEAVSILRQALGDDAQTPRYVQTIHRRGYRFVAELRPVGSAAAEQPLHEVAGALEPSQEQGESVRPRARLSAWITRAIGLSLLAGGLLGYLIGRHTGRSAPLPSPSEVEFSFPVPEGGALLSYSPSLAFSPDGRWLAIATYRDDKTRLFLRALDSVEIRELPGTEGATAPFFSPDGLWVAYFADGKLKRVSTRGGQPITITPAPKAQGGAWAADGTLYYSRQSIGGLWRIPAEGGEPEPVTHPDPGAGEVAHIWPHLLPEGRGLLYTIWSTTFEDSAIAVQRLDGSPARRLVERAGQPIFVPPDRLVFVGAGGLQVAGFDPVRLELTSIPQPLAYPVSVNPTLLLGVHAISPDGALAFRPGTVPVGERRIAFLGADGTREYLSLPNRFFRNLAWDPIHSRFAATVLDGERSDVWIGSGDGGALQRLTFDGFNIEPRWSADGRRVTFASSHGDPYAIHERVADGSLPASLLVAGAEHRYPDSWRSDGESLLFGTSTERGGLDLWMLERRDASWAERPFLSTEADEIYGRFSPDGRWVAYLSNASGPFLAFVRPAEGDGGPWQISTEGGFEALWSPDGSELYYNQDHSVMAVSFSASDEAKIGEPHRLFETRDLVALRVIGRRRFIALLEDEPEPEGREEIRIVLHAFAPHDEP
jgi:eukaryotic-like serine/threonine-protein kinase